MLSPASQPHSPRDLIVTASRLDPPKRLDLLIRAYGESGLKIPFWIVGTGPDQASLQALAAQTPGVVLKGYLSQEELVAAYQRALFVPFAPYQEDYGLITVEAYMAGAAVVTTSDAGGPTEMVEHGQTGLVAEPNVASLAQAFCQLASPEMQAQRQAMAQKGKQQVQALQWSGLAQWLFSRTRTVKWPALGMAKQGSIARPKATQPGQRPRLLVLNTFAIEPTVSGGRLRMKGLYTALSQWFDIHLLSLASPIVTPHVRRHSPWVEEELVPVASPLLEFEASLSRSLGVSAFDLAVALRPDLLLELQAAMERELRAGVDAVICSHPYCFPAYEQLVLREPELHRPVVYEAHNVEWALKLAMFPKDSAAIHAAQALETRLLKQAQLVVASSDQDRVYFQDIAAGQGVSISQIVVANNAMDMRQARPHSWSVRQSIAEQQGFYLALFAGSWHGPNLQAVDAIIQAAERLAQNPSQGGDMPWRFVVLGSVGHAYAVKPSGLVELTTAQGVRAGLKHGWHRVTKRLPGLQSWLGTKGNAPRSLRPGPQASSGAVHFAGVVSEQEKQVWLARASVGLNPILTGSGTNLKMAEYAAWGLPVLSTAFGARGGIWQAEQHYGVIELAPNQADQAGQTDQAAPDLAAGLIGALNYFSQQTRQGDVIAVRAQQARQVAQSQLDWQVSADAMRQGLVQALGLVVMPNH
jgi:glycosyltransferase involved in cell wall biosynthesis